MLLNPNLEAGPRVPDLFNPDYFPGGGGVRGLEGNPGVGDPQAPRGEEAADGGPVEPVHQAAPDGGQEVSWQQQSAARRQVQQCRQKIHRRTVKILAGNSTRDSVLILRTGAAADRSKTCQDKDGNG